MLIRTHLAFAILLILLFVQHVNSKIIFIFSILIATVLPDLDTNKSESGKYIIFRPLQLFVKHRGIIHSVTTGFLLSILTTIFFPLTSFGFFMGYSTHLICDSFTREGIQPFWPLKIRTTGPFSTGGKIEESLFFSLIFINIALFFLIFVI